VAASVLRPKARKKCALRDNTYLPRAAVKPAALLFQKRGSDILREHRIIRRRNRDEVIRMVSRHEPSLAMVDLTKRRN